MSFDPAAWPYPIDPESSVLRVSIPLEPQSKQRARLGRGGHVFTPDATRQYECAVATIMSAALPGGWRPASERFGLRAVFYRSNRQRIDCDNLLKAISDAATGLVWVDDSQVLEVFGRLFLRSERARTELAIYRVPETDGPDKTCGQCGKPMRLPPSLMHVAYCSTACMSAACKVTNPCPGCGVPVTKREGDLRRSKGYCSRGCGLRHAGLRRRKST